MITLTDTEKRIGHVTLWTGLSRTLNRGTTTALIGPSGSGKSTLLNCIGCIDDVSSGTVRIDESIITEASEKLRRRMRAETIGYLFQDYALVDNCTVQENVALALPKGKRGRRGKEATASALDAVGLADRAKDRVHLLSGGQQQRVAVARLLVRQPPVILADEPTGALDRANGELVLQHLKRLAHDGACVVIATHDPWVMEHCDDTLNIADYLRSE